MTAAGHRPDRARLDAQRLNAQLRLSGLVATAVFAVMVASDLLMLTTLDFSQGAWNVGGVAMFALSTALLWHREA